MKISILVLLSTLMYSTASDASNLNDKFNSVIDRCNGLDSIIDCNAWREFEDVAKDNYCNCQTDLNYDRCTKNCIKILRIHANSQLKELNGNADALGRSPIKSNGESSARPHVSINADARKRQSENLREEIKTSHPSDRKIFY